MRMQRLASGTCLAITMLFLAPAPLQAAEVTGEPKKWHRVTLTFRGPEASETGAPNPFTDCRLTVTFRKGTRNVVVPGYFAADGHAGESGAEKGNAWRVHFAPDEEGAWEWTASFRQGEQVALSEDPNAGAPGAPDGEKGTLTVGPTDKSGRDHRAAGALRYTGGRYLQFAQTGAYYLKGGADSPENLLAYADFDGTYSHKKGKPPRPGEAAPIGLHRYEPHVRDWREGDPTWRGGKGKGLIGGLNYLSGKGVNSVYFLTMNVTGDGDDVWPWTGRDERARFDCSKLDQWEIVFDHMDQQGLLLHVITQETENDQLLDGGDLGPQRKLYYRELIARFGHHPALVWNLGEENTNTPAQLKDFTRFIRTLDPYDHPIVVHTYPGQYDKVYTGLLGVAEFEGPSLQMGDMKKTHAETLKWVKRSAEAKRQWVVCLDEIGPADTGVKPDADDPEHDAVRHHALWGNLMAGGAGVEWYFGYKFAHNDLNCEDWRSREKMWDQTRHALEFFQKHLPFAQMNPADELITAAAGAWCLAKPGEVYAVYLPTGGVAELDLGQSAGRFAVKWYDPRQGGALTDGAVKAITGPGKHALGNPPADPQRDWVVRVQKE